MPHRALLEFFGNGRARLAPVCVVWLSAALVELAKKAVPNIVRISKLNLTRLKRSSLINAGLAKDAPYHYRFVSLPHVIDIRNVKEPDAHMCG
jgi:hypothetical protein